MLIIRAVYASGSIFDTFDRRRRAEAPSPLRLASTGMRKSVRYSRRSSRTIERVHSWWESIAEEARKKRAEGGPYDPEFAQKVVSQRRVDLTRVLDLGIKTLQFDLLRAAPLLKNESFSEEQEWRLVLPWISGIGVARNPELEFRSTSDTLAPYTLLPLGRPGEEGAIPCKAVILGPGSHASAELGVDLFLRKEKVMVMAQRSRIPYRPA